jgi:hypothetical protein
MIPVDSIAIPVRFQHLCAHWHGNVDCMLYAVCSTGGLTIGNRRPYGCDTDEKWYYHIWRDLAVDVDYAVRAAAKGLNAPDECDGGDGDGHDADYPELVEFSEWVDAQCEALMDSYGLADWEV